jgi:5-methylcytosine-specific restriction endonuclease McrA
MMKSTLLLNATGEPLSLLPLSTVSWEDAMRLLILNKVRALEYYEDRVIRSANKEWRLPSVIISERYVKRAHGVNLTRRNLYLRDKYTCAYCDVQYHFDQLTKDHVIPSSKGGDSSWTNLVTACKPCNGRKGDTIIDPLYEAFEPTHFDLLKNHMDGPVLIRHYSWKNFISGVPDEKFEVIG